MTTENSTSFSQGDWIVHRYHGVGQIEASERMRIRDQENTFFRVKMIDGANTTIWIPIDHLDDGQVRSITDKKRFQEAIEVFNLPPKEMDSNLNIRKSRIKQVIDNNQPKDTARLIRDLRARQSSHGGINQSERQALRDLTKRFLQEWAVCQGVTIDQARQKSNRAPENKPIAAEGHGNTDQNDPTAGEEKSLLDTLIKQDPQWAKWFKEQLAEEATQAWNKR